MCYDLVNGMGHVGASGSKKFLQRVQITLLSFTFNRKQNDDLNEKDYVMVNWNQLNQAETWTSVIPIRIEIRHWAFDVQCCD